MGDRSWHQKRSAEDKPAREHSFRETSRSTLRLTRQDDIYLLSSRDRETSRAITSNEDQPTIRQGLEKSPLAKIQLETTS